MYRLFCLTICSVLISVSIALAAFPTGWRVMCPITITAGKTGNGVTGYPVLLTQVNLPAEIFSNGIYSSVSANGGDIRFTSNADGTGQLPVEVVRFDKASSKAEIYVKTDVPAAGATIYLWYGMVSTSQPAATDTYGSHAVWDSNFSAVWHFAQDPSTTSLTDSTANAVNGASAGSMTTTDLVSASYGLGWDFDRANDHASMGDVATLRYTGPITFEAVAKPSQTSSLSELFSKTATTSGNVGYFLGLSSSKWTAWWDGYGPDTLYDIQLPSTTAPSTSRYDYITVTYDNTGAVSLAEPPQRTTHGASAMVSGTLYTFGGHNGTSPNTAVGYNLAYNTSADTWSTKTAMTTSRIAATAAEVGGVIYVMGGDTSGPTASVKNEAYNIIGNSWSAKTDCPHGGAGVASAAVGTTIYLTNGTNLDAYDTVANTWSNLADMPVSVGLYPRMVSDGTNIYVCGGYTVKNKIYRYVPATGWDAAAWATIPYNSWAGVVAVYNGWLYYGLGRVGLTQPQSRDLYKIQISNPGAGWTQLPSDAAAGNALFYGETGGHLYIFGKRSPTGDNVYSDGYYSRFDLTSEAWETTPAWFRMYVNGSLENSLTGPVAGLRTSTAVFDIGSFNDGAGNWWGGIIEEVRLSGTARSTDYITAEYNNLMSPATFATAGTPVTKSVFPASPFKSPIFR